MRNYRVKRQKERERQWGSKLKGSSVLQSISKEMASLWKRCANLFTGGQSQTSLSELNKGTLVYG